MFGDGIASCTLKEHNKLCVYICLGHIWPTKIAMLEKHHACAQQYFIKIYNLHYLTEQNIIEPHGYPYHFSVFGGHRRP